MKPSTTELRERWGIPDWRDEQAYPKVLSDRLWRWEFLRRRKDYRRDWELRVLPTLAVYRLHKPQEVFENPALLQELDGCIYRDNFGCWPGNPDLDRYWARFRTHMPGSIQKYGLDGLPNPAKPAPDNLRFEPAGPPGTLQPGRVYFSSLPTRRLEVGHCVIVLDPRRPHGPQLNLVTKTLGHKNVKQLRKRALAHRVTDARGGTVGLPTCASSTPPQRA